METRLKDIKSYLWMTTFNVYGKILLLLEDLEGQVAKELDQQGDDEYTRDIERLLTILEEIKERTEPYSRAFFKKFKSMFLQTSRA